MNALYFLIPMALLLLAVAFYFFQWSLRRGHLEDLESPAHSILIEDREERLRLEARDKAAVRETTAARVKEKEAAREKQHDAPPP